MQSRVSSTESVVCVRYATLLGIGHLEVFDLLGMGDHEHPLGRLAHGAHHLVVVGVADEDDRVALARVADRFEVDLGHQRARGVDHAQAAPLGLLAHRRRDAVGAEDHGRVVRAPRPARPRSGRPWRAAPRRRGGCARSPCARTRAAGTPTGPARRCRWPAPRPRRSRGARPARSPGSGMVAMRSPAVWGRQRVYRRPSPAQIAGLIATFRAWPSAMRASASGTSARPMAWVTSGSGTRASDSSSSTARRISSGVWWKAPTRVSSS